MHSALCEDSLQEKTDIVDIFRQLLETEEITTLFQPIVSLRDGSVHGYEALSRGPAGSPLHYPVNLIAIAKRCGMFMELEKLFIRKALENSGKIPDNAKLFINIAPAMICDEEFRNTLEADLERFSIKCERLIFEFTERENIGNTEAFLELTARYRKSGCRIAIDDVGAGYSGLNLISTLRPQYIKLDMGLIHGIDRDPIKQAMVQCMANFATRTNIIAIAEGIETREELTKLIELDVSYAQGYLIQRPSASAILDNHDIAAAIFEENKNKNRFFGVRLHEFHTKNIKRRSQVVSPDFAAAELDTIFTREPNLPGVSIVNGNIPVGIVTRTKYYEQLGGRFGFALNANKAVSAIMDHDFMMIDGTTTIDTAATLAMSREPEKMYDFAVVVRHGKYDGIVTVKDLLEKSIEIGVANAKHLNPLSELPGNMLIDAQLEKLIAMHLDRTVLYIDIDNFKAYNDYLGFKNGDNVLKRLSAILKECDNDNRFIGHIGGDDFLMIVDNADAESVGNAVINSFDAAARSFYPEADLERGYITVKNRKSVEENFPLISVSIAGVRSILYNDIYALGESAAAMKKSCKQKNGSVFLVEPVPAAPARRGFSLTPDAFQLVGGNAVAFS